MKGILCDWPFGMERIKVYLTIEMVFCLQKFRPRYCNRRGRPASSRKTVVVPRMLPLLPKAPSNPSLLTVQVCGFQSERGDRLICPSSEIICSVHQITSAYLGLFRTTRTLQQTLRNFPPSAAVDGDDQSIRSDLCIQIGSMYQIGSLSQIRSLYLIGSLYQIGSMYQIGSLYQLGSMYQIGSLYWIGTKYQMGYLYQVGFLYQLGSLYQISSHFHN